MKKHTLFLLLFLSFNLCFASSKEAKVCDIIFTHDVHSFLDRLSQAKTIIDEQKKKNPDTFIFDAGDFAMGTLYQTVFETQATELRTLGAIGVDAFTIGNHEFDYGSKALANMFNVALNSGDRLPEFVLCNVDTSKTDEYTSTLRPVFDNYMKEYTVIEKGDVRIGVTGILGKDGVFCAPTCELTFLDQYESVKKTVSKIKANEDVDMIVVVSHGGTNKDPKKSEDEILAKMCPDIDLIISGHTHTRLDSPILIGNTYIVSSGEYSEALGLLSMTQMEDNRWLMNRYDLYDINHNIPSNDEIDDMLSSFRDLIDSEYLSLFGYKQDDVLTNNTTDLSFETEVGYLMAKGLKDTVSKIEYGENNIPVDFAVVPSGCIRGTFNKGDVTVGQVYESYSLGIGQDGIVGYPLVSLFLNGKELKLACEIDCSLSPLMSYARLYTDGINYVYNPHRLIFNKVTDVNSIKEDGSLEKLEDDKLYRIVTDMYTANMIGSVLDTTYGLMNIVPKNEKGEAITDYNKQIIYMEGEEGEKREIKAWYAVARYLETLPFIPSYSYAIDEAITVNDTYNPIDILRSPSLIALIIYGVILFVILLVTLIVLLIVKKVLKKKRANRK